MKILMIEEEKPLAESLKTLLETNGFEAEILCDSMSGQECTELVFGNTALDLASGTLTCGKKNIRLSAKEFGVMRLLLQNPNQNMPKENILTHVWGYDSNAVENHVEVYVGFLRKKLARIGSNVKIVAIRRLGYHLEVAEP